MSWFSSATETSAPAPELEVVESTIASDCDSEVDEAPSTVFMGIDLEAYDSEADSDWEPTSEELRDAELDEDYEAVMDDLDGGVIEDEELIDLYKDAGILSEDVTVMEVEECPETSLADWTAQALQIGSVLENVCANCGEETHMVTADEDYVYLRCEACSVEKSVCPVELYKYTLGSTHKTVRAILTE